MTKARIKLEANFFPSGIKEGSNPNYNFRASLDVDKIDADELASVLQAFIEKACNQDLENGLEHPPVRLLRLFHRCMPVPRALKPVFLQMLFLLMTRLLLSSSRFSMPALMS